jgi:hypothetical protein
VPRKDPAARAAYQREYKRTYKERRPLVARANRRAEQKRQKITRKTGRGREPVPPAYRSVVRALRGWFPLENDYPLVGKAAITDWLVRHGFLTIRKKPPTWDTVLDWQARTGHSMFRTPSWGPYRGQPVSTHYLMLAWALAKSVGLGPSWSDYYQPGETKRKQASRRSGTARP